MTDHSMYERLQDRCPECLDSVNYPRTVLVEGESARATYRCPVCRHAWYCSWSADRIGLPAWSAGGDAA